MLLATTVVAADDDDTLTGEASPATWMIHQYQTLLSPSKADTCKMHPSCSEYARQAYEAFPFWKATLLTTDRLTRSDHDQDRYELVDIGGRQRQYDPIPGAPYAPPHMHDMTSTAPIHPVDVPLSGMKEGLTDDEKALDFARYLHCLGKTDEALVEYLRFLRLYPSSSLASSARVSVMHLHYDARDYRQAILWAEQEMQAGRIAEADIPELRFWVGAAYTRMQNPERARATLPEETESNDLNAKVTLLHGYIYAQEENWAKATSRFRQYGQLTGDNARTQELTDLAERAGARRKKSPALAGALGIVPGLGYLYAGYPESAVSALILDSLLLAASYKAFDDGNEPLGALLGIVGIGWYAGSIYGSISAADRRNEDDIRDTLLQLNLGFRF